MAGFISGNATLSAGSVSTAALADNAVTLAKMAGGTDGNLIGIDASGDPAYIATGDDGQVLTSGGTGVAALMEAAAAGGAWNLIGTEAAPGGSGTATLDVTGLSSTYDSYAIGLQDILPITDSVSAYLRVGDSSGVDSASADYSFHLSRLYHETSTYSADYSSSSASILLTASAGLTGGATGEGIGGMLFLHRPGDGTMRPNISGSGVNISTASDIQGFHVVGQRKSVITLDRIQFLFSSGNVESGRMTIWGIAHA